jgi:phage tail protein X
MYVMKSRKPIARLIGISSLLFASAAHAEWVPVGPAGIAQFFIDKATIKRKADTVQVWELVNMEKVDGEGVHSSRFLVEYDCKGKRSRGLDMQTYKEPMGAGKVLQQLGPDPDGWEAVPPDSIFAQRMGMACGK